MFWLQANWPWGGKCKSSFSNNSNSKRTGSESKLLWAEVVEEEESDLDSGMNFLSLYTLKGGEKRSPHDPIMVVAKLNGKVSMEVDTGAAVSVMSKTLYKQIQGGALESTGLQFRAYTGEVVKPEGVGRLHVYKDQVMELPVTVIDGQVPNLLGRDWLTTLKLSWSELFMFRNYLKSLEN